jgi:hypothetical protein
VLSHPDEVIDPRSELRCKSKRAPAAMKASSKSSLVSARSVPSIGVMGCLLALEIDGLCIVGSLEDPLRGDEASVFSNVNVFGSLRAGDDAERGCRKGEESGAVLAVGDFGDGRPSFRSALAGCLQSGGVLITISTALERGRLGVVGGVRGWSNRGGLRLFGDIGRGLFHWVGCGVGRGFGVGLCEAIMVER